MGLGRAFTIGCLPLSLLACSEPEVSKGFAPESRSSATLPVLLTPPAFHGSVERFVDLSKPIPVQVYFDESLGSFSRKGIIRIIKEVAHQRNPDYTFVLKSVSTMKGIPAHIDSLDDFMSKQPVPKAGITVFVPPKAIYENPKRLGVLECIDGVPVAHDSLVAGAPVFSGTGFYNGLESYGRIALRPPTNKAEVMELASTLAHETSHGFYLHANGPSLMMPGRSSKMTRLAPAALEARARYFELKEKSKYSGFLSLAIDPCAPDSAARKALIDGNDAFFRGRIGKADSIYKQGIFQATDYRVSEELWLSHAYIERKFSKKYYKAFTGRTGQSR